jgi:multidrug resistance efflux pump
MNAFRRTLPMALASAGLLVGGCNSERTPAPSAAPAPFAAVARGRIDVEGGLLNIGAPLEGRIARVLVHEGQHVNRGDPLIELDNSTARLTVATAEAGLREALAQLRSLATQSAAATTRAERLRAAAKAGAGEGQAADDAEALVLQLAAQRDVVLAEEAAAATRLATQRHELELHTLNAPQDALVIEVLAQVGAQVGPTSSALLVLLPETPRIVRAELSVVYADAVRPQMPATVSPDDAPEHSWPAHVLRISAVVGPARLEEDAQRRAEERTVECILSLDGPSPLRVGQRVLARIGGPSAAPKD